MNYLDLFSGIGGFHLGLKWSGFKFNKVYYSEIDKYANKVYKKNFPDAIPLGDITKINPEELPSIDIVTAGFPCQDISVAGKQEGINAKRSGLFYEIIRLCSVLRPKIIFLENVPNLISGDSGRWFKSVLESLAEIGYDAEWQIISAADVGAQHLRKRIWIVCYPECEYASRNNSEKGQGIDVEMGKNILAPSRWKQSKHKPDTPGDVANTQLYGHNEGEDTGRTKKTSRDEQGEVGTEVTNGEFERCSDDVSNTKRVNDDKSGHGTSKNGGEQSAAPKILRPTGWLPEPQLGRVANGIPRRVDRLKCLGNAVVPQVVQLIGGMILDSGLLK